MAHARAAWNVQLKDFRPQRLLSVHPCSLYNPAVRLVGGPHVRSMQPWLYPGSQLYLSWGGRVRRARTLLFLVTLHLRPVSTPVPHPNLRLSLTRGQCRHARHSSAPSPPETLKNYYWPAHINVQSSDRSIDRYWNTDHTATHIVLVGLEVSVKREHVVLCGFIHQTRLGILPDALLKEVCLTLQ